MAFGFSGGFYDFFSMGGLSGVYRLNDLSRSSARQTGPALEAHYQFILWLVPTLERFPRSQKFLLGDRIQSTALDVLESLIEREDPDMDEVLLLADGMGGHVSGDTASRMVIKTFVETYHDTEGPTTDRLRDCLTAANHALAEATDENPELTGMGSTVVAAVISQHGLDWISVGDSPCEETQETRQETGLSGLWSALKEKITGGPNQ